MEEHFAHKFLFCGSLCTSLVDFHTDKTTINKNDMASKVMITMFSLFAELERYLISHRAKEALRSKQASGVHLGKPKGTVQGSIYDKDKNKIIDYCVFVEILV